MPAVRSQSLVFPNANTAVLSLDTSLSGLLVLTASRSGNVITFTLTKNGVVQSTQQLTNPTVQQIETLVGSLFGGSVTRAGLTTPDFQIVMHVISQSPLVVQLASFDADAVVPANWWLE